MRAIAPMRSDPAEKTPPDDVIGDLGGGHVEDPDDQSRVDQLLHRLPAGTGGVEHQRIEPSGQFRGETGHQRSGDAEHRQSDRWEVIPAGRYRIGDHAGHRVGRIAEHVPRDAVEAGDVGDRVHHGDVGGTDVRCDVRRCHRRHHQLRDPDGEGPHGRGDERGTARSACADDAGELSGVCDHVSRQRLRHRRDRFAPVRRPDRVGAVGMVRGDVVGGDVSGRRVSGGADVDEDRLRAGRTDDVGDVLEFGVFGVTRPDDEHRGHDVSSGRPVGRRPGRVCPERRARRAAGRTCRRLPDRCGG